MLEKLIKSLIRDILNQDTILQIDLVCNEHEFFTNIRDIWIRIGVPSDYHVEDPDFVCTTKLKHQKDSPIEDKLYSLEDLKLWLMVIKNTYRPEPLKYIWQEIPTPSWSISNEQRELIAPVRSDDTEALLHVAYIDNKWQGTIFFSGEPCIREQAPYQEAAQRIAENIYEVQMALRDERIFGNA